MRSPLPAFQAFAHDAGVLSSLEDERAQRLQGWLAVAKAAERLSGLDEPAQARYLASLSPEVLPPSSERPSQVHDMKPAPTDAVGRLSERLRLEAEQMEQSGCFELAYTTVSAVCQLTSRAETTTRLLATMQLGRIVRHLGDMDSATDCYQQVIDVALHERDGSMASFGFIGLGNVARYRGNRPVERSMFERALTLAHPGGAIEAQASQGLMNVAISEQRHIDALLHGWRAFDLAPEGTETRAMILSNLALVSLQTDFAEAALKGFRHTLELTDSARVRLPAIGGAIRAAARLREDAQVRAFNDAGDRDSDSAQIPFESARFLMHAGEAWALIGDREFARRRYQDARALALAFGFHEVRVRVEDALDVIDRETPPARANLTSSSVALDRQEKALVNAGIARLEALGV